MVFRSLEAQRIIVDHQRAKSRHKLDNAGDGFRLYRVGKSNHALAHRAIDGVAELDDEGRVACGEEAYGGGESSHRLDADRSKMSLN